MTLEISISMLNNVYGGYLRLEGISKGRFRDLHHQPSELYDFTNLEESHLAMIPPYEPESFMMLWCRRGDEKLSFGLKSTWSESLEKTCTMPGCQRHRFLEVVVNCFGNMSMPQRNIFHLPQFQKILKPVIIHVVFLDWKSRLSAYILNQMPTYQGFLFSNLTSYFKKKCSIFFPVFFF